MNINELVDRMKECLDMSIQETQWTVDDIESLFAHLIGDNSGMDPRTNELVEAMAFTALYALTLSDSRFDDWRFEFRNELG